MAALHTLSLVFIAQIWLLDPNLLICFKESKSFIWGLKYALSGHLAIHPYILQILFFFLFIVLFWAAASMGMKSCRTQADFCSSVRSSVRLFVSPTQALSGLKSALSGLKSALSGLKSALSGLESALSGLKSAFSGLKPVFPGLKSSPQIQGLRGQISGLRGQISGLGGQISGLRGPGGTNEQTNGRTDKQKSPCVLQDFVSFGAAAQKENETSNAGSQYQ